MSKISFKKNLMKDATPLFSIKNLDERLKKNRTIDYRKNYRIKDLNNGYVEITPIEKDKLWK